MIETSRRENAISIGGNQKKVVYSPRDYLGQNRWAMIAETCMAVIQVPVHEISSRAQIKGRGRGVMFKNMEGPRIVLDGVTWTPRSMPEFLSGFTYMAHWYVRVGVNDTQPTNEIAHVKIEEEEKGHQAIRPGGGYRSRRHGDRAHVA